MEIQFAMAPPISFPARIIFLAIGFLFAWVLVYRWGKSDSSLRRIPVMLVIVIASLSLDSYSKSQGFLALVGGCLGGSLLFAPVRERRKKQKSQKHQKGWLIVASLISGPILGVCAWGLELSLNDVHPLDRIPLLIPILIIGSICGSVVASMIALAKPGSDQEPHTPESDSKPSSEQPTLREK